MPESAICYVEKFLSLIESEKKKAKLMISDDLSMVESDKGKAKLLVSEEMVNYVLVKYGKNKNIEDRIADVIPIDLRIKYGKWEWKVNDLQNKVERLKGDLARAEQGKEKLMIYEQGKEKLMIYEKGKAKQTEDDLDDVDMVDALNLENRIKKLLEDFNRLLEAKKAKKAKEAKFKVKKVSIDEGDSSDEDVVLFNDVKYLFSNAEIRIAPTSSTRSGALIASNSNAQVASTAPRGKKIAMIGCVLALRAPNDPNTPSPSATRKRKP
uniref:Uncharacterized protein n=1 Tax=Tanacetum cinerariifolium TaxID=118510 RepID=A0A699I2X9_TANCI|nr:hypothetical protein [Tanacetum cinerariifolium]